MRWIDGRSRFQGRGVSIDPMADWLIDDRFAPRADGSAAPPGQDQEKLSLHVLVRLAEGRTAADLASFDCGRGSPAADQIVFGQVTCAQWRSGIEVPSMYRMARGDWKTARFCTARVSPRFVEWLADFAEPQALVESITICAPPTAVNVTRAPDPSAADPIPRGPVKVVMGLIDDGLAMASERFRAPDATSRVAAAWIQQYSYAKRPAGFDYGRLLGRREINLHLARAGRDEDAFYNDVGLFNARFSETVWSSRRMTHATHIMDVAAGYGADETEAHASERPIVAVQLPQVAIADGSGHSLGSYLLDGLRFIASTAETMAEGTDGPPAPVVVTISYGNNAGPHDGSSDIERAIDEVVSTWRTIYPKVPFVIVLPAGNSYRAAGHAQLTARDFKADEFGELSWEILPDDGTANVLQVWLPARYAGRFSLQVTTPGGLSAVVSNTGIDRTQLIDAAGAVVAEAIYCAPTAARPRAMMLICVRPTADQLLIGQAGRGAAPAGRWNLRLAATGLSAAEAIDLWIQRDDLPRHTPLVARRSCFVRRDRGEHHPLGFDEKATGFITPEGAMNALASGDEVIVAGGCYFWGDMAEVMPEIVPYSGGGSERDARHGVDLLAPAEDSPVLNGVLAAGLRSGAQVALNGTSVAAPYVARWVADNIEEFKDKLPKEAVASLLTAGRRLEKDERAGWGRVDRWVGGAFLGGVDELVRGKPGRKA